jgi:hypothetical protein
MGCLRCGRNEQAATLQDKQKNLQDNCGKIIKKLLNHLATIILHIHKGAEI